MKLCLTVLTLTILLSTMAEYVHEAFQNIICSDTEDEYYFGYDEEEFWHADIKQKRGVSTFPDFIKTVTYHGLYEFCVDEIAACKRDLPIFIKIFKSLPLEDDAPQTSIYSKDVLQVGVENTLICHVTGFFPPFVNISWTKNNANMTEGISVSQYRPKKDGTFNIFSTLKFTPAEGDIYSCTVNHRTLQGQPLTKTWDVDVSLPSVGPGIFCGLGLTLGLLGVATGTFFLVKGSNCNRL